MLILILKLVQSVFVCVYTPKQTFELIYIRLKPQAYVSHPAAYVWKIVCTWFVNFDLVCTDDIQQIVNLYNQPQTTSPIICVLATCRQAILTSASPRSCDKYRPFFSSLYSSQALEKSSYIPYIVIFILPCDKYRAENFALY